MESGGLDIDDYEGLPENVSASTHMIAGATAGITEHCVMYPVDCIKTRMQALNPVPGARYSGITDAMRSIVWKEGFGRAFHGMPMVIMGAGPSHAMYFACYEKLKTILCDRKQSTVFATLVAGGCATLFHDAIMVPTDAVKQRMQMYNSPYSSSFQCLTSIIRQEGIRALYRSYTTQLAMNIPFQMVHFSIYEQAQNLLNYERQYNPWSHMISGGLAGATAAFVTNPLDVCKTLLNTQEVCCVTGKPAEQGLISAVRTVIDCKMGYSVFFRGAQARMVFQMPSAAISWSVYEFFKHFVSKHNQDQSCGLATESLGSSSDERGMTDSSRRILSPVYPSDYATVNVSTPK